MQKAVGFSPLAMSKSGKELDKSVACSKYMGRICTFVVFCMCSNSSDKYATDKCGIFSSATTKAKTQTTLLEFCSETQRIFFPFVKGKLKDHSILMASTANQTNPDTSPVGKSFSSFGSQMWGQPGA